LFSAGGLEDQPAYLMDAWLICDIIEAEVLEEAKKKRKLQMKKKEAS
jgi:hypothetical protein